MIHTLYKKGGGGSAVKKLIYFVKHYLISLTDEWINYDTGHKPSSSDALKAGWRN